MASAPTAGPRPDRWDHLPGGGRGIVQPTASATRKRQMTRNARTAAIVVVIVGLFGFVVKSVFGALPTHGGVVPTGTVRPTSTATPVPGPTSGATGKIGGPLGLNFPHRSAPVFTFPGDGTIGTTGTGKP